MKIVLFAVMILISARYTGVAAADGIVSLDLCTDRMLLEYADPSSIRSLSPLSRTDLDGHSLPVHDGSLEQVVSLAPHLVITGEFNALLLRGRLQELGVTVEIMSLPRTLQEVTAYEKQFLELIDVSPEQAGRLSHEPVSGNTGNPTLLLLGANAKAPGRGTIEDEILEAAGFRNYVRAQGYTSLDLEKLVAEPPDMIMWYAPSNPALANRIFEHTAIRKAVPRDRWIAADYRDWQCQGPWTWARIQQLSEIRQQWRAP